MARTWSSGSSSRSSSSSRASASSGSCGGRWDWPVAYHQRLWGPQPSRPLSWVVRPPLLQARMWSPWHWSAGTKQVLWSQRRCRTSRHAAQGAPEAAGRADVAHPVGAVGHHPSDQRLVVAQQLGHRAGSDDGPGREFADPAGEGVEVDHHRDQRRRPFAVGGGGQGPGGHLDQGVVAPLRSGAGQMGRGGGVAVDGFGRGPVGGEQLAFDPRQRPLTAAVATGVR